MIFDKLSNAHLYTNLNERIKDGLKYLESTDFSALEPGKHEINGESLFALVNEYSTKNNDDNIMEAHRQYIDLQYVFKGEEIIEYETLGNQAIKREYDNENDYSLFTPDNPSKIKFSEGMFAILFPEDLHMPGLIDVKPGNVKKIVVKILID